MKSEVSSNNKGDELIATARSQPFICACCRGRSSSPAGLYALPPKRCPEGNLFKMHYPLVECTRCHHVTAHPLPSALDINRYYGSQVFWESHGVNFDATKLNWLDQVTANSGLWERFCRAKRQFDFIRHNVKLRTDARIIDIGSGYSPFLYQCRMAGFGLLHALEPSKAICNYLRDQGVTVYPQLLEDFIERNDLPVFDVMVISHTLEHLITPSQVLQGLRRHLVAGGMIYIDVPFMDHLRPYHQGLHTQFFNPTSIERLAEQMEFDLKVVEHDSFGIFDKVMIALLYYMYGLFLNPKGGVSTRPIIDLLHRLLWRPLRSLFGLKVNIFISSMDLRALLVKRG
jgi:SAM-dependent methyltransferase